MNHSLQKPASPGKPVPSLPEQEPKLVVNLRLIIGVLIWLALCLGLFWLRVVPGELIPWLAIVGVLVLCVAASLAKPKQ